MFLSRIPIDLYGGYDAIVTSVGMDKRKLRLRRRAVSFRLRIMRATAGDLGSGGLKLPRLLVFFLLVVVPLYFCSFAVAVYVSRFRV